MSTMSTGFDAVVDALGSGRSTEYRSALGMLGERGRDARLEFNPGRGRRRTACIHRWLAIVRLDPAAGCATTLVWVLDTRSARWSGGLPPGDLHRGRTGLDSEEDPILWFRASAGCRRRGRAANVTGVFGAAGIVDAAEVSALSRTRNHVQLRMTVDTRIWRLSANVDRQGAGPQPAMTIKASGVARSFDVAAIKRWT
jgi:hypothetical protein